MPRTSQRTPIFFALLALAACNSLLGIDDATITESPSGAAGVAGATPPVNQSGEGGSSTAGASGAAGAAGAGGAIAGGAGAGGEPPGPPPTPTLFFEAPETVSHLVANETQVYWGEGSVSVRRLPLQGGEPQDLAGGNYIIDLTLSPGGLFFVTEIGFGGCCMLRGVPVDGGQAQDLGSVSAASYLTTNGERLYFRSAKDTIVTVPFAGGEPRNVLQDGETGADAVSVSYPVALRDALFWVSTAQIAGTDRVRVRRATLASDGTSAGAIVTPINDVPASRLSLRGDYLYWVRADVGTSRSIMRTPMAGGESEQIVAVSHEIGPYALDDSHVYYVEIDAPGAGAGGEPPPPKYSLRRSRLEPTNADVEDIVEGRDSVSQLALNAGAIYWAEDKKIMRRAK